MIRRSRNPTLEKFGSCFYQKSAPDDTSLKARLMITLLTNDFKRFTQAIYDETVEKMQIRRIPCSCGCSGCMVRHGFYLRRFKDSYGTKRIRILRLKCTRCKRTHAILPAAIVPYSQISLACQQTMLRSRIGSPAMETMMNANPDIDESSISHVRKQFRRFWEQRLHSEQMSLRLELPELVKACFHSFCRQFMQIRSGNNLLFSPST